MWVGDRGWESFILLLLFTFKTKLETLLCSVAHTMVCTGKGPGLLWLHCDLVGGTEVPFEFSTQAPVLLGLFQTAVSWLSQSCSVFHALLACFKHNLAINSHQIVSPDLQPS